EHVAVADEEEVGRAGLLHLGVVVEQGRVVLVERDLAAVDATGLVAPRDEHVTRVEDLLVEPAAPGEAGVGARGDVDRLRRYALVGRFGALARSAHFGERAEVARTARSGARGRGLAARRRRRGVVGAPTACARNE